MRIISLSVERSSAKLSDLKLKPSGKQIERAAGFFYVYVGDCIVAEATDFESLEKVNELDAAIVAKLGKVKRDSDETGAKAGDDKGLLWCLNNGGLRLAFNDRILERYRIAGGTDLDDGAQIGWASVNAKHLLVATSGVKAMAAAIRKYREDHPEIE